MIPRTLVPTNVRPVDKDEVKKAGHRVTTYMDDRTVVPSGISDAPPLDGRTTIPSHLPLDVLVHRTLVPRGMAATPIERVQHVSTVTLEILDTRTVVPARIEPLKPEEIHEPERAPEMTPGLLEIACDRDEAPESITRKAEQTFRTLADQASAHTAQNM